MFIFTEYLHCTLYYVNNLNRIWQRTSSGEDPTLQQTGQRVREAYRQVIEPDSDEIQEEMVTLNFEYWSVLIELDVYKII